MSPGRDQAYFCEGLAEELITALTHIEGLRVVARAASFQARGSSADVGEIGRRLGVGVLLDGSVRKVEDRLRVTVQLIDVETGYHRWSERFDRTLADVFAIQDGIATRVAQALRGTVLSGREVQALARPQTHAAAYDYYLRGRLHLKPMLPDLERSREMFERAIQLDANYAPAFAGLAMVHALLYEWFGSEVVNLATANGTSRRALELAPHLAESHVARGLALSLSQEPDQAAAEFERAIRINPQSFDAHHYYGRDRYAHGDFEGAAELFRRAVDLCHEEFPTSSWLAQCLTELGRHDEASEARHEGLRRAERILALNPSDRRVLSLGSISLWCTGQHERAREWHERSLELYPDDSSTLANAACLCGKSGRHDDAIGFLERLVARGWGKRGWIEHEPDFRVLHGDPRFQELLAKLAR
jgi:TolB-like protein/tetratricopeptide (TPR) repeat protein